MQGPVHFLNLEYFLRILYDTVVGVSGTGSIAHYTALASTVWLWVTVAAYGISLYAIGTLVYANARIYQTAQEDAKLVAPLEPAAALKNVEHSRWQHVETLIESPNENDWRQAIIEADIILEDLLATNGYIGDSIGEKLRQANPANFHTLQDAWEAHKVRNEIAHQGSTYLLGEHLAHRTIARYKNVFLEFGVL